MNKWKKLEAAILTVAFIVVMFVSVISTSMSWYLSKIGHPVWGVVLCVLRTCICYIAMIAVWGCGYVSGITEKEKEDME